MVSVHNNRFCLPVWNRLSCSAIRRSGAHTASCPPTQHELLTTACPQCRSTNCWEPEPSQPAAPNCRFSLPAAVAWTSFPQHKCTHPDGQRSDGPSSFPSVGLCARADAPMVVPHGRPGHCLVHHVTGRRRRHRRVRQCGFHVWGHAALPHCMSLHIAFQKSSSFHSCPHAEL